MRPELKNPTTLPSSAAAPTHSARSRLSEEEEAWIAYQLEKAPPLSEPARRRIEQLLSFPPANADIVGVEVRAS